MKIDVNKSPKVVTKLGVRIVPTSLMFKGGEIVGMKVGLDSRCDLKG